MRGRQDRVVVMAPAIGSLETVPDPNSVDTRSVTDRIRVSPPEEHLGLVVDYHRGRVPHPLCRGRIDHANLFSRRCSHPVPHDNQIA